MANPFASNETVTKLLDTNANPAPLGLMGFGLTTILLEHPQRRLLRPERHDPGHGHLLRRHRADHRRHHGVEEEQHVRHAGFHVVRSVLADSGRLLADARHVPGRQRKPLLRTRLAMAWFFVAWGVFTGYMFIGTLKLNRALQVVFGLLTILFFLLAIRDFGGGAIWGKIAGWEGIVTGLSAVYAACAQTSTRSTSACVLPLGPVSHLPKGFVQDYGEEIAELWLKDLRISPQTPSYGVVSDCGAGHAPASSHSTQVDSVLQRRAGRGRHQRVLPQAGCHPGGAGAAVARTHQRHPAAEAGDLDVCPHARSVGIGHGPSEGRGPQPGAGPVLRQSRVLRDRRLHRLSRCRAKDVF